MLLPVRKVPHIFLWRGYYRVMCCNDLELNIRAIHFARARNEEIEFGMVTP